MSGRIRRTFSYANVTSTLALFAVMAGTSYAAVTLAKDSVGSRELKNNAVTSAEVKNGSLTKADFVAGTLLTGPQGPQGAQGPAGATGPIACADGLLCPDSDLPGEGYGLIKIDGFEIARVTAYRTNCATTCQLVIGGPAQAGMELDTWYDDRNLPNGTKNFSFVQYSKAGVEVMRFWVDEGKPETLKHQNGRFEMTYSAASVARMAS